MLYTESFHSPIGTLIVQSSEEIVVSVYFSDSDLSEKTISLVPDKQLSVLPEKKQSIPEPLSLCIKQLEEYFRGERTEFSVPLSQSGSPFEELVWNELKKITFGSTVTYSEIATRLGNRRAVRAVGNAAGKNKILLLIPCHRMIGSNNSLTGYAAGIWRKEWLLRHEAQIPIQPSLF